MAILLLTKRGNCKIQDLTPAFQLQLKMAIPPLTKRGNCKIQDLTPAFKIQNLTPALFMTPAFFTIRG
jgi:ribosomal protein L30/L7E